MVNNKLAGQIRHTRARYRYRYRGQDAYSDHFLVITTIDTKNGRKSEDQLPNRDKSGFIKFIYYKMKATDFFIRQE